MGVRGTAASWPRRSEVAAAELGRDGVARGGGVQSEGQWVQEVAGVPRGAVGEAGASLRPSSAAGGAAQRRHAEKAGRERGGR